MPEGSHPGRVMPKGLTPDAKLDQFVSRQRENVMLNRQKMTST